MSPQLSPQQRRLIIPIALGLLLLIVVLASVLGGR